MYRPEDVEEFNQGVEDWSKENKEDLVKELDRLQVKHFKYSPNKVPLRRAIKERIKKREGLANKITVSMPRSAVFLHKGVSRGHGINNPRTAKEWYAPVVDRNIGKLADIAADKLGDAVVNALKI